MFGQEPVANVDTDERVLRITKYARSPRIDREHTTLEIVRADEFVTVVNQIAVTVFADSQRCLRFLLLSDVAHQDKLRRSTAEAQTARGDVNVDNRSVFLFVSPFPCMIQLRTLTGEIL